MYQKTLLLCFGIFELVSADCNYNTTWNFYTCNGLQSEDLPLTNHHGDNVRWLQISASNLREIPENAFNGFPSLTIINLSGNKIESVADGAFNGLPNLEELNLDYNDLTSLSLSAMPGLTGLSIEKNKISNFELKLDKLRHLVISDNLMTNLTFLEHLPKLKWLDVSGNRLSCVDEDIFRDLPALEKVYLSENPWRNGCGTSLAAYFEGRNVDVGDEEDIADSRCDFDDYSRIYSCDEMLSEHWPLPNPHGNEVTTLNISASGLREIPENAFNVFPSLRTLHLRHNDIESVADGAFNGLPNLEKLNLNFNELTNLSLSAMPGLRGLFIGRNKISSLELKLDELRKLDIHNNLLTNLTFLEHLPKLKWLDVSGNRLSCVDEDIFRDLPALKYVHLGDNRWQNGCGTSLAAYFEGRNVTVVDKDQI